jgi:hypothetical protein
VTFSRIARRLRGGHIPVPGVALDRVRLMPLGSRAARWRIRMFMALAYGGGLAIDICGANLCGFFMRRVGNVGFIPHFGTS